MERNSLRVDLILVRPYHSTVVHIDRQRQRENQLAACHLNDNIDKEDFECAWQATRTKISKQMSITTHIDPVVQRIPAEQEKGPQPRRQRDQHKSISHVRHAHEIILLQKPRNLIVRIQRMPQQTHHSLCVESRPRMIRGRPHDFRLVRLGHRPHGKHKIVIVQLVQLHFHITPHTQTTRPCRRDPSPDRVGNRIDGNISRRIIFKYPSPLKRGTRQAD